MLKSNIEEKGDKLAQTKTHNIFLINKEKVKDIYFSGEDVNSDKIIDCIMRTSRREYKPQSLKKGVNTGPFNVKLFYRKEPPRNTRLSSFCKTFIEDDQDVINDMNITSSSIMFVYSNDNIFVITTGQGFRTIENFCVPKFGMMVVSTFQKLFKITALDSNGMSSIIHSSKTIYTNEIDLVDVDSLDTIFKEVTGRLNDKEKVHSLLNLKQKSKKKSVKVIAKNYVQFSSSLDFANLIHLLKQIDSYNYSLLQDEFNVISPVSPKQNKATVDKNNQKVIQKIFNALSEKKLIGMDLFHRYTNEFISADMYRIEYNSKVLIETDDIETESFIYDGYIKYLDEENPSIETFTEFVNNAEIIAKKGDNDVTSGSLLSHTSGEIEVDNKNYYVFYGEYYYLSDSYTERLNRSLKGKLQTDRIVNYLQTKWEDSYKEDDFNEVASNNEAFIHLHKVKPEYIEFADLIKIDGNKLIIIHVKDGFDDDMRALDRQVEMSVSRILDLKNNNNDEYMKKLYNNAKLSSKGRNIATDFPNENSFIKTVKEKEIQYIIAIRPPRKELLDNRSNIAKHCLNALILRCFNHGIDLKINIL